MATDRQPGLRERKKEATRARLVEAGWSLFTTRGYDETTVAEIAEAADISPRTFFHYFESKDALLHAELDGYLADLGAAFAARPADEPVLSALFAAMEVAEHRTPDDPAERLRRLRVIKASAAASSSTYLQDRVSAALADMVRLRYPDDPEVELRSRLIASVSGAVVAISLEHWLEGDEPAAGDPTDIPRRCLELLREMIAGPPA